MSEQPAADTSRGSHGPDHGGTVPRGFLRLTDANNRPLYVRLAAIDAVDTAKLNKQLFTRIGLANGECFMVQDSLMLILESLAGDAGR